jgi:uncharacterized protein (TIGR03000 family)
MCSFMSRCHVLALVTLLAVSDFCLAGRFGGGRTGVNYGYFPGRYRGGYGGRYWNNGYWPGYYGGYDYGYVPSYYPPTYYPQPTDEQRSYYPPAQPAIQPPAPATATIELYVPPSAEVWFQGKKTTQTGTVRRFVTPPFSPGTTFTYDVRIRWTDANGEVQDETRNVTVTPGQQLILNFQEAPKK